MKVVRHVICSALVVAVTACSAFRPDSQMIRFTCNHPETQVVVNSKAYQCPGEASVRRDRPVMVEAYKEGYGRYNRKIGSHLSTSAKWDIAGTFLLFFPVFGLLSAGAWDLDETEIYVSLSKP